MHEEHPLGLYEISKPDSWATTWEETSKLPRTPKFLAHPDDSVDPFELFVRIHMLTAMVLSLMEPAKGGGQRGPMYPAHLPNPLLALGIDETRWADLQNIPVSQAMPMPIRWCVANARRYKAVSLHTGVMYHVDDELTRQKHEEAAHAWAAYLAYMFQGKFTCNDGRLAGASVHIMHLLGPAETTHNTHLLRTQLMTVLSEQGWAESQRMSVVWFRKYMRVSDVERRLVPYATQLKQEAAGGEVAEPLDNPPACPLELRSQWSTDVLTRGGAGEDTEVKTASVLYWRAASMWSSGLLDTQWMLLHLVFCPATRELAKTTAGSVHDALDTLYERLDTADPGVAAAKTHAAQILAHSGTSEALVERYRQREWEVFEEVHAEGIRQGKPRWGNEAEFDSSQANTQLKADMRGNNGPKVLGPCKFGLECAQWHNTQHEQLSQCLKCSTWFHESCANILTTLGTGPMVPDNGCCSLMCEDPDNGKMLADAKQTAEKVAGTLSAGNEEAGDQEGSDADKVHHEPRTTRSTSASPAKVGGATVAKRSGSKSGAQRKTGKTCIHDEMLGAELPCISAEGCAQYPCANSLQQHSAEVKQATWLPRHASPRQGLFATADLPAGSYVAEFGPFRVLAPAKHNEQPAGGGHCKEKHVWRFDVYLPTALGAVSRSIVPKRGWQGKYHGAKVNHTCCPTHQNAKYVSSACGHCVYVRMTKPARRGTEILVAYNGGAFFKDHSCACCACAGKCMRMSHA
jgi:hypothetical protein